MARLINSMLGLFVLPDLLCHHDYVVLRIFAPKKGSYMLVVEDDISDKLQLSSIYN